MLCDQYWKKKEIMMDKIKENVGVVMVTYGDGKRLRFVKEVINAIRKQGASLCVLVNNGTDKSVVENELQEFGNFVDMLHLESNGGSAFGYAEGIRRILTHSVEFIWLLDDDNLPKEDALNNLLYTNRRIKKQDGTPSVLLALREHRSYLVRIANGESVNNVYPRKNSIAGFHFLSIPGKVKSLFKKKSLGRIDIQPDSQDNLIQIPFGPYGGMFFPRKILEAIGLPDKRFYLYGDDTEFTYRITQQGWRIFLVPSAVISDLEKVWYSEQRFRIVGWINNISRERNYYVLRNWVYFDIHYWCDNVIVFMLNALLFIFILCFIAVVQAKYKQLLLVLKALKDAKQNRLGFVKF